MRQFIRFSAFLHDVFDEDRLVAQAARIIAAILAARSPRLSDIAQQMPGKEAANYKQIQRFLHQVDAKIALRRLFQADAPFVIGDPTEMPRPQARKTGYVGILKDGKTRGFWLLLLATPYRGRALPCGFVTYSSKTIAQSARSRNQEHWAAFDQLKTLLGDKPLVLDREFSYLELLDYCAHAGVSFVIRLQMGSQPPTFLDGRGHRVLLTVRRGQETIYRDLRYRGQVTVNVVGVWPKGQAEPLWVMSNLAPEQALAIYAARMKIEESFRDLKTLLSLDKLMNKSQPLMEQMVALVLLAFTIGVLVGEAIRDELYGPPDSEQTAAATPPPPGGAMLSHTRRKWQLYSGLFIVLKRKITLSTQRLRQLQNQALAGFAQLVQPLPVRT